MPTATQTQQRAPQPGELFDVPGIPGGATQWTEQDDTTVNLLTAQSSAAQVPVVGIQQFRQTDVVRDWFMHMAFTAQAYVLGTTTTVSAYAPFNSIGPVKVIIQNQYASVDVENGIDLAIFNMVRPYRDNYTPLNLYANPAGAPIGMQPATTTTVTAPTFPATTVSVTNPYPFPVVVYISGNATFAPTVITINGSAVTPGTAPAAGTMVWTVVLPVGGTIAITYGAGAGSWVWQPDASGQPNPGYLNTADAQANQVNPVVWSVLTTSYNLLLRLPAAQWFDQYYDLAVTGEPLGPPHPALVSPQYMAGTTRVIVPSVFLNPGLPATTDLGPVVSTGGGPTFAGNATLRLRRRAVYAGNPAILPPVYAWQYRWKTQRFAISGVSRADLLLPLDTGQLLFTYVRLFDPSAAAGVGAPINVNVISRAQLQYGSGLSWFDAVDVGNNKSATLIQALWLDQHQFLLPQGVIGLDLGLDERMQFSNKRALNTLSTAGILWHLEFTAPLSATAYAVVGTESLVYVT